MSPNTGLCSDWRRASNHQRTRWRAAVAVPAVTPELKGYHYTVRSCGRSGRAGDKWDRGTRRVMKSDFKGREGRQEVLLFFFLHFSFLLQTYKCKWSNEVKHTYSAILIPPPFMFQINFFSHFVQSIGWKVDIFGVLRDILLCLQLFNGWPAHSMSSLTPMMKNILFCCLWVTRRCW